MDREKSKDGKHVRLHAHRCNYYLCLWAFFIALGGGTMAIKIDIEDMTVYKNELQAIVSMYCDDNNIDESNIYPTVWNDILTEIYEQIYLKDIELLHDIPNQYNSYNYDKVLKAYYIYKRLCNNHSQEISQKGFLTMTGIDKQTLYNWSSSGSFDLQQKMQEDNQESLEKLMFDRRNNPMKYLPKLNRYHGYNMSGVRENTQNKAINKQTPEQIAQQYGEVIEVKTAAELPPV